MQYLILFMILLPMFSVYRTQIKNFPDIYHMKAMIHMLSMIVAQVTFIICFLYNEFTPGYIYAGIGSLGYNFAYDGISLTYLVVSSVLTSLCIIALCEFMALDDNLEKNMTLLLLLEIVLFNFFLTRDLFTFYVWFEAALPVLFLIILLGGERKVRLRASLMLFLYTLIFSLITLCTIIFINGFLGTTDLFEIILCDISFPQQAIIYIGFLVGFCVKVPSNPFHVWLPHAHVEASTIGSVLLAGIILKMGGYAILRILLPTCPNLYDEYNYYGSILGYISVLNTSLIILTESDLKRLIAYFSIIHMNIALIATFAGERLAIFGAVAMMISHSLIASGLFFCIGSLYERYQIRDMTYYGGLVNSHILFSITFFIFVLSNFSFPLTFGFWPEMLVVTGLAIVSYFDVIVILISGIFSLASNLTFFTKVFFGITTEYVLMYMDMSKNEMFLFGNLIFYDILFGFRPNVYLIFIENPVNFLLTALCYKN